MRALLSGDAEADLDELWWYYFDAGGAGLASRVMTDLHGAVRKVAEFPNLGHRKPELTDAPVLFYLVHSLYVIYEVEPEALRVLRIVHASRDLPTLLR